MNKDSNTGAVLNSDKDALNKYKSDKKFRKKIEVLTEQVDDVKHRLNGLCKRIESLEKAQKDG